MKNFISKRKIGRYILIVLIIAIVASAGFYEMKFLRTPDLSNIESVTCVDNHHRTIGDYVVISEENGIHTFPFFTGGSLSLLSIPDGKKYGIIDDRAFLKGFGNPVVDDECVYYIDTWDGSEQGGLYRCELDKRNKVYLQTIYNEPFYIMKNRVYYLEAESYHLKVLDIHTLETKTLIEEEISSFIVDEKNIYYYVQSKGDLCIFNLEKDEKENLTWNVGNHDVLDMSLDQSSNIFLQTGRGGIIKCDGTTNKIQKIAENGDIKDKVVYYKTDLMHLEGKYLYYLDEAWNIYRMNIDSGEMRKLLKPSNLNFLHLSKEAFSDSDIVVSWCDNYIVFQISAYTEEEAWKCGIIAFDYEGNEVYRNGKMRLNL